MGFVALFAFYAAFLAFHKPCRALATSIENNPTTLQLALNTIKKFFKLTNSNLLLATSNSSTNSFQPAKINSKFGYETHTTTLSVRII